MIFESKAGEKQEKEGIDMAEKIRPEEVTTEVRQGLRIVDGHAVKEPEDYQDPDELYQYLIGHIRKYHPSADVSMIEKAYELASKAHANQFRKSGEAYIHSPPVGLDYPCTVGDG